MLAAHNLLGSRVGRAMRTLRGGDALVESLGINAFRIKLATFVLAALMAGIAGWLYAHLGRFVSPTPFDVHMSILFLMMAMVGGSTSLVGGVVGAALITWMKNSIQDYLPLLAPSASGQLEIVVFSGLFILFLQRARNGIVPYVAQWLPEPKRSIPPEADPLPRRVQPEHGQVLMQVEGAERRFGGLIAVNDVSFEVRTGEILGLIGPNGAGKSTMFNLMTGALRPSGGRIRFAGKDISRAPQRSIAAAGIARTFQHVKLRPRMSLLDTVLLGTYTRTRAGFFAGALRLDRSEERQAQYEALRQLDRVGLGNRPYELAGNLPLGNQRVLEIARALAADPILLVLDEPAAGLRRQEKLALANLLRSLRAEGLTILLVEHDMDFVMNLVDRIVVMDFGCKLCEGGPQAVRSDARVQEAYLGGVA
jgi:branched-chain amino acid transport system permease protein